MCCLICTEIDNKVHESHKVIPLSRVSDKTFIDQEITSLTKAISDLEAALGKKLQPQIDTFTDTYTKHAELNAHQADRTKALLEGNNGELVKNAVCPGYHDFFTGYLRFANSEGSEPPTLLTENGRMFVQIPVALSVKSSKILTPSKASVAFCDDTNKFLQSLGVVRTVEYRVCSSEGEPDGKWIAFNKENAIIENFSLGTEYSIRAKYTLKSNSSSFAYGKIATFKKDEAREKKLAEAPAVSTQSTQRSDANNSNSSKDKGNDACKKEDRPPTGPEYEDISHMENGLEYYNGTFRKGNGYRLSDNDTVMTILSNRDGWKNPAIGTVPFVPGARNRWFYMFRKSSLSWVTVGITTDPSQNPIGDATSFWGLSFHNKHLVKGKSANFSTVGDFNIPKGLDTGSSVFGLELDMRSETNSKLYVSFWDNLGRYSLAFEGLCFGGKNVYPVISAYNQNDEFMILGEFGGVDKSSIEYDNSTGIMARENPVSTRKIVLKKEEFERIFGRDLDGSEPSSDSKLLDLSKYIEIMKGSDPSNNNNDGNDEGEGEGEGEYEEEREDDEYVDRYGDEDYYYDGYDSGDYMDQDGY